MSKDLLTECEVYTKVFALGIHTERGRRKILSRITYRANEVNKTFIESFLVNFLRCL